MIRASPRGRRSSVRAREGPCPHAMSRSAIAKGEFVVLHGPQRGGQDHPAPPALPRRRAHRGRDRGRSGDRPVPSLRRREVAALRRSIGIVFQDAKLLAGPHGVRERRLRAPRPRHAAPRDHGAGLRRARRRSGSRRGPRRIPRSSPRARPSGRRWRGPSSKRPPLLLADEPTGNLDDDMADEILEVIKDIWAGGAPRCSWRRIRPRLAAALKRRTLTLRRRPPREGRGLSACSASWSSEALRDLRTGRARGASAPSCSSRSRWPRSAASGSLSSNLGRAVAQWRERVRIVVYLKREPPAADADALVERVRTLRGVPARALRRQGRGAGTRSSARSGKDAERGRPAPAEPAARLARDHAGRRRRATPEGARALVRALGGAARGGGGRGGVDWVEQPRPLAAALPSSSGSGSAPCSRWPPSSRSRRRPRSCCTRAATRWRSCGWWAPPRS